MVALQGAQSRVAASELRLSDRCEQLVQLKAEVSQQHIAVRTRQDELEPIQGDLQAKEADLNERQVLFERRRAKLTERESKLEKLCAESANASKKCGVLRQSNEDAEQRLARLWDDIHQRQQVLDDIGLSLRGREERLTAAEHSLVCAREAQLLDGNTGSNVASSPKAKKAWHDPEAEQVELELTAAELAERAWRERSAALADREEKLLAQLADAGHGVADAMEATNLRLL